MTLVWLYFQRCPKCGREHWPGNHLELCERCWFKADLTGIYLEDEPPRCVCGHVAHAHRHPTLAGERTHCSRGCGCLEYRPVDGLRLAR
jgi:hypothetical protein